MKSEHKKATYEDKFARKFYCNSHRFIHKMKKVNNKQFRQLLKKQVEEQKEG